MFPGRNSAFKPLVLVPGSGRPEESETMPKSRQVLPAAAISNNKFAALGVEIQGSNSHVEDRKKVDRSSSGSNTTSSTELETDVLQKHERGNEESNGQNDVHCVGDSSNRRSRITANTNDSWKEVSEEGRVAFRALFSRQVLPQKFPSSQDLTTLESQINIDQVCYLKLCGLGSPIDLNSTIVESCCTDQVVKSNGKLRDECEGKEAVHSMGLGKLRTHKTGFKPYKRSSVEAKDISVLNSCSQGNEKRPRRICLDLEGGGLQLENDY
ncbi:unnamed protein product [Rhodiola kirilowii]